MSSVTEKPGRAAVIRGRVTTEKVCGGDFGGNLKSALC
jgi:hypothetical protein